MLLNPGGKDAADGASGKVLNASLHVGHMLWLSSLDAGRPSDELPEWVWFEKAGDIQMSECFATWVRQVESKKAAQNSRVLVPLQCWGLWAVMGRASQMLCVQLSNYDPQSPAREAFSSFSAEEEEQGLSTGWLDSRVTHRVCHRGLQTQ